MKLWQLSERGSTIERDGQTQMRAGIRDIAVALPDRVVTNSELNEEHPDWNFGLLAEKAGVCERRIAANGETALDLAERACRKLFSTHPILNSELDILIFCTQTSDHLLPPNSCILHGRLGLSESVATFDLSHACSGYIYALAQAQAFIRSTIARNVVVVNADTYSKLIHPADRSTRALFGDGAAATWLSASDRQEGIIDVVCRTAGIHYDKFIVRAGGCRLPRSAETAVEITDESGNVRTAEHVSMSGREILAFVNSKIPRHVEEVLARNQLSRDEIDFYVFHQASAMVLDSLTRLLRLPKDKVVRDLSNVGNTVSASIPIAIHHAWTRERWPGGTLALMCGFGVGLSWGSALVRF